jgi:hypothetical protein
MRTLVKVTIPVEGGNKAILDGTMPRLIQEALDRLRPEAAYFYPEQGCRTALMVIDMKESSSLPEIVEPFFTGFNARVECTPVMNAQDLQAGLAKLPRK